MLKFIFLVFQQVMIPLQLCVLSLNLQLLVLVKFNTNPIYLCLYKDGSLWLKYILYLLAVKRKTSNLN